MKKWMLFLFVAVIAVACGQDKSRVKAMEDEAIAIHDEVMPEMGTIIDLKGQLKAKWATVDTADLQMQTTYQDIYTALETAEEGMKSWMHSYEVPDYTKPIEELEPVMIKQLEDIKAVHASMKKSIADAQALLAK